MNDLHAQVATFIKRWSPYQNLTYVQFVDELRELLESYGKAALKHQSLPDTEHEHGEGV